MDVGIISSVKQDKLYNIENVNETLELKKIFKLKEISFTEYSIKHIEKISNVAFFVRFETSD